MEGEKNQYQGVASEQQEEVKDRGLFDFLKKGEKEKEKSEEETITAGLENVHVTEFEEMEVEEKKDHEENKEGLFAKLHRSDSSSSSSVSSEKYFIRIDHFHLDLLLVLTG